MSDPTYPLFSIFAFLGVILSLIPFPWHFQAWNSGTCYFMIWTSLACLNQFVNSVVWAGNALNPAPIWCDISTRVMLGASVGIPAASLCISRRLYHITAGQAVTITHAEKRRSVIIDSLICVLFPLIFLAIQYIVQGHRFNIFEDIGCQPALYNTLLTYFLSTMWPIVIGLISAVYCVLSLRSFARRRVQFNQFLTSNKSLTISRYFRLMALAMAMILFTTPLAAFIIWLNATATPLGPWRSFADTHFAFSRVEQIPSVIWRGNHRLVLAMELSRWVTPLCAFVFFSFFGFAEEAKRNYRLAFWGAAKFVGFKPKTTQPVSNIASIGHYRKPEAPPMASTEVLPAYTQSSILPMHRFERSESLTSSLMETLDKKTAFEIPTPSSSPTDRISFHSAHLRGADDPLERHDNFLPHSPHDYYDQASATRDDHASPIATFTTR